MISCGAAAPLGSTVTDGGVNFSVYSRGATGMELALFERDDDPQPSRVISFDPVTNRTHHYWHMVVPGLKSGQLYSYRAQGPADSEKYLLDPYGREVAVPANYSRVAATRPGENAATAMKSVVVDPSAYDWEGDAPLNRPFSQTIIYEMHVRGFTQNPNSDVSDRKRGKFAGVTEKIPYLQQLGISAVELLPVFAFDVQDCPPGKVNYWGYAPVSFFAPHSAYGSADEFRDMVKAFHRAGIEVILDVVYNHTAEGDHRGPILCHRGLDPETYYILEGNGKRYANYSGTGNTLNANHSVVRRMIVDSLRYWVESMHVDGFRFDLASILSRDESGHVIPSPPVLWDIESDPALAGTKLIAEAWDAAGLYQVGSFLGDRWKEWNGRFRDDARSFFRGDGGASAHFADRLIGSPNIFGHEEREPEQSINFVTCHDGFGLNDVVSYNLKHNEANGEQNRDGADDNRSWNCGVEGPSDDPAIEKLRNRQVKNFLAATLLSVGVPMLTMGDEVRRTQAGNNNPYCLDNESNWFDWSLVAKHADVHRFASLLLARRQLRSVEHEQQRLTLNQLLSTAKVFWHGTKINQPDWSGDSRTVALSTELPRLKVLMHFIFNAFWEPLEFELPQRDSGAGWLRWIDTSLESPDDIVPWQSSIPIDGANYLAQSRSVVVLWRRLEK